MTFNEHDERAAREWAEKIVNGTGCYSVGEEQRARTILRLLDRPMMPRGSEVPDDVVNHMWSAYRGAVLKSGKRVEEGLRAAIDVLHAHLTAPPEPKKVEAWAVVFPGNEVATYPDETSARICAGSTGRIVKLVEAADADA